MFFDEMTNIDLGMSLHRGPATGRRNVSAALNNFGKPWWEKRKKP